MRVFNKGGSVRVRRSCGSATKRLRNFVTGQIDQYSGPVLFAKSIDCFYNISSVDVLCVMLFSAKYPQVLYIIKIQIS
jgi:hypothetical protein